MKLFECQNCRQPLYFELARCPSCGHELGYLPTRNAMTALQAKHGGFVALADPKGQYRYCANAAHNVCNWLLPSDHDEQFCAACRHNRTIRPIRFAASVRAISKARRGWASPSSRE